MVFPRIAIHSQEDVVVASALNVTDIVACEPLSLPGVVPIGESGGLYWHRNTVAMGRAWVSCEGSGARPDGWVPACDDPAATIRVVEADTPTGVLRLHVSLPEARMLVLAEPFYPERRAWVDGVATPIEKTNVALSAVRVGAGDHLVELRYVPTSFMWGSLISVSVLMLWSAWCITVCAGGRFNGVNANRVFRY